MDKKFQMTLETTCPECSERSTKSCTCIYVPHAPTRRHAWLRSANDLQGGATGNMVDFMADRQKQFMKWWMTSVPKIKFSKRLTFFRMIQILVLQLNAGLIPAWFHTDFTLKKRKKSTSYGYSTSLSIKVQTLSSLSAYLKQNTTF